MSTPFPDAPLLLRSHRTFLGKSPTENQERLYAVFPEKRGVSNHDRDPELFEATVMVGLVQTYSMRAQPEPFRVFLFVPPPMEKWAFQQLREIAERIFEGLKARKASTQAQTVGKLFHAMLLGGRVLRMTSAPERWAAFGYSKEHPIPDWLKQGLLDAPGSAVNSTP